MRRGGLAPFLPRPGAAPLSLRAAAPLLALALAACAQHVALPEAPVAAGPAITISATAVPLDAQDASRQAVGEFRYAGGLALVSPDTARLHGLSDMALRGDQIIAVSDEGDLLKARLVLDKAGRLAGLSEGKIIPLVGLDGKVLPGKMEADAEGLALMPNGDMLVSFEQRRRIWLYPAKGGPPRAVPFPDANFPANGGMEALAPDPTAGPDAYVTAGEESGETWTCRLSGGCVTGPVIDKPAEFGVVAVTRLSKSRTAWLLRAWDPVRGSRVTLSIRDKAGAEVARLDLARPLTVDNFEALAAVPDKGDTIRFYLLSDDNFQSIQRTLLLAFDWTPSA